MVFLKKKQKDQIIWINKKSIVFLVKVLLMILLMVTIVLSLHMVKQDQVKVIVFLVIKTI